jgi:hypothetical protein
VFRATYIVIDVKVVEPLVVAEGHGLVGGHGDAVER